MKKYMRSFIFMIISLSMIGCNYEQIEPMKWESGKIPYIFDSNFTEAQKDDIRIGMEEWEAASGSTIKFVEYSNGKSAPGNAVRINITEHSNSSTVGDNAENNYMHFNVYSMTMNVTIIHELGHVIGLYHEHQRPDRDNFIIIHFDKIPIGSEDQYRVNKKSDYDHLYNYNDYDFDYDSIVLYRYPIGDTQGKIAITGNNHISEIDKQKIYDMYK